MKDDTAHSPIVLTGIGPICPQATSVEELATLISASNSSNEANYQTDWFDPDKFLGRRGHKYFTPSTRYALAATGIALKDAAITENSYYQPAEMGVALGTNFGLFYYLENMDATVMKESANYLSPMEAPNFSINIPSSQVSMKYGLKAYNITLTTPMIAGLEAILIGKYSIIKQRARMVAAGTLEDRPSPSVNQFLGNSQGEGGSGVFILESYADAVKRQARIYAQLGEGSIRYANPEWVATPEGLGKMKRIISQMITKVLPSNQSSLHLVNLTCTYSFNQSVNQIIHEIVTEKGIKIQQHSYPAADGSLTSLSPLLQLAGTALANGEGLVVGTSPQGHIVMVNLEKISKSQ